MGRDADEVEAAGAGPGVMGFEPGLGGAAEAFFLRWREGFEGALQAAGGACLHFHEDDSVPLFGHDVQFELTGAPVAVEYGPAEAAKMEGGRLLAFSPGAGSGCGGRFSVLKLGRMLPGGQLLQKTQHSQPCSCFLGGRTPLKSRRCRGQGPNLARASLCSLVP